jgi:hypothetical protein
MQISCPHVIWWHCYHWLESHIATCHGGRSQLGCHFWDKGLKDYVAVDLGVYHDLLLFDQ